MALDPLKAYLQLASGLGDLTRAKATEAADALLSLSSSMVSTPMASQVASLADEMMSAASANRESLRALVQAEVERALAHALSAPGGELDRARAAIATLTSQFGRAPSADVAAPVRQPKISTGAREGSSASSPISKMEGSMATTKAAPAKKAVTKKAAPAKKAVTKKAVTKKAVVKNAAPAKKAVTKKAVTKKAVVTKAAPAKKAAAKKSTPTTKKTVATKAAAKKSTPTTKKSTPAKKSTPVTTKATAKKSSPAKKTAAKKAAAKK